MAKDGKFVKSKKVKRSDNKKAKELKVQKYKMAKPYRQVAYQLNKAYDEVKNSGLTNNTIKLYERTLEQFYQRHGIKVKNPRHISIQKTSNDPAIIQELADITMTFADMALEQRDFYLSDIISKINPQDLQTIYDKQQLQMMESFFDRDDVSMFDLLADENMEQSAIDDIIPWNEFDIDKFNKIKKEYGVESVQEFVDWTDEMERYRSNAFLSEVLSSDQIGELWAYAQSGDIKVNRRSFHMLVRANYNATGMTGKNLYNVIRQKIDKKKGINND